MKVKSEFWLFYLEEEHVNPRTCWWKVTVTVVPLCGKPPGAPWYIL